MRSLISVSIERAESSASALIGLELFDVVHDEYRKIKRYCYTWNMLYIRYICLKDLVLLT